MSISTGYTHDQDAERASEGPSTWLHRLDERELAYVRAVVARSHRPFVRALTGLLCRLGNGWLYVILVAGLLLVKGAAAGKLLWWTAIAGALTFPIYWAIKRLSARIRPLHRDPSLDAGFRTLDRYSFPSGHAMTAAAIGLPFGLTLPYALVPFLMGWLLIAWSRLASGHHYPTDVIAGALLGAGTSLSVMAFLG